MTVSTAVALVLVAAASGPQSDADSYVVRRERLYHEIVRGFNAATFATRDKSNIAEWKHQLDQALVVGTLKGTNSLGFIAGAEFGFSFCVAQVDSRSTSSDADAVRKLAGEGALARIHFEEKKQALGLRDIDLITILELTPATFAIWKNSVTTSDRDETVVSLSRLITI